MIKYKYSKGFLIFCCIFAINGCNVFDSKFDKITKKYYVGWIDDQETRSIFYSEGNDLYHDIIPPCIVALGWNEKFMIIRRYISNEKQIQYYIIDIKKNENSGYKEGIWGPFSQDQFQTLRKEMKIPDKLNFTKKFNGCGIKVK